MSSPPVIPPRPSRSSATSPPDSSAPAPPSIPPRPANRNRSKSPLPRAISPSDTTAPIPGTGSVASSGAEIPPASSGVHFEETPSAITSSESSSPEQTRKIDPDLDLHQPQPKPMSAAIAIPPRPNKERSKASHYDDSTLPPQIGQRAPLLPYAGDVQAPTPDPNSRSSSQNKRRSVHGLKTPSHDTKETPAGVVGDFGAYPSGSKVYRQGGTYSLSHDDLNLSVMQAFKGGAGVATTPGLEGVPDEEIGYLATEEYASRHATPQGTPGGILGGLKEKAAHLKSPLSTALSALEGENDEAHQLPNLEDSGNDSHGIYGKSPAFNESSTSLTIPHSGTQTPGSHHWSEFQDERHEGTPILASDEVQKSSHWHPPAVSPRMTAQEIRRPSSIGSGKYQPAPVPVPEEDISEPPSPIEKPQPLFPSGASKLIQRPKLEDKSHRSSQRFPSKDIWEDAPESAQVTYEVEDAEISKDDPDYYDPSAKTISRTTGGPEEVEAAKKDQKETAEAEAIISGTQEEAPKASTAGSAAPPPLPSSRPAKRADNEVPRPYAPTSAESPVSPDNKQAPAVPDRPKPGVPPRPAKKSSEGSIGSTEEVRSPPPVSAKPKPVVPPKVGGGIAALRANFMNDLNSRLSKGPVAPKKEEVPAEEAAEPKEEKPLEDVRKGRVRGPAKRKPGSTTEAAASDGPKLTFSTVITVFSFGGDDEEVSFGSTKFGDDDKKEPIETEIAEGKADEELVDTSKEVTSVDTSAAIVPEPEEKTISPSTAEESKPSIIDTIKDTTQSVVDAVTGGKTDVSEGTQTSEASAQTGETKFTSSIADQTEEKNIIVGGDAQTGKDVVV